MKKYLYVFFAFLACLFVSQNVHASSPSYDVLYYGGTLTLDNWDDATYEEELVYYFKDSHYFICLAFLLYYVSGDGGDDFASYQPGFLY